LHAGCSHARGLSKAESCCSHVEVTMMKEKTFFDVHLQAFSFGGYGKVVFPR